MSEASFIYVTYIRGTPDQVWKGLLDAEFTRYMTECVQCRACEDVCPSSVAFGHLMEGARETLAERSATAQAAYRALVWEDERFVDFFRAFTPVDELALLEIGSRPARRPGGCCRSVRPASREKNCDQFQRSW